MAFLLPVVLIFTSASILVTVLLAESVPVTVIPSALPAVLLTLIFNLPAVIVVFLLVELIADNVSVVLPFTLTFNFLLVASIFTFSWALIADLSVSAIVASFVNK